MTAPAVVADKATTASNVAMNRVLIPPSLGPPAGVTFPVRAVEIFDVSVSVRPGMVVYPGDPTVYLSRVQALADGATANVSKLELSVHTGTHVDAPAHFIDGAAGIDALPLGALVGPARVIDATAAHDELDVDALRNVELAERLLFKTPNSTL